jgi:hypothetical protein
LPYCRPVDLCAPAFAADRREAERERAAEADYRCFWSKPGMRPISRDPYLYFIPQYYPLYRRARLRDRRILTRR